MALLRECRVLYLQGWLQCAYLLMPRLAPAVLGCLQVSCIRNFARMEDYSMSLQHGLHCCLRRGVGYAQQAAAREASQFARLSALNSTSTEASLAASRAAAWLAAGSNTPAGSPGRGSAELPSESTWHEGPQQPRLVPGSGLSAGGTSSAAGLGSRPGSGTGWPLGLRPGSSSAALSPVYSQDAQSVTVLVGGIHAVHRQRQLERAGSGSKGSS